MAIMMRGLRGELVKRVQEKLGVAADGIFGGGTESALKEYQDIHGLTVDGIAGPDTFASMGLRELIVLKRGSRGDTVRALQEALSIDADGKFGPGTERAVRSHQEQSGLEADGIAGPGTLASLDLFEGDEDFDTAAWGELEEDEEGALQKAADWSGFAEFDPSSSPEGETTV